MRHFILALVFVFCMPFSAHAASLYLSPASLTLSAGQTGTFSVYVESTGQAMNAVSGTVSVDSGVTVGGASKAGSVISFWAAEPSAAGTTVSFEGVVLNGYTGAAGKILSFTVRAQTAGTYAARFSSGSVLANDGQGTNITSGTRGGTLTVTAAKPAAPVEEEKEQKESDETPDAPAVRSQEFPSGEEWYAKSTGTFSWEVPAGVTAVRTLLDQNDDSTPSILLDGRTTTRTVSDIPEGVNYFHVQFKNAAGWGDSAHIRVAVDITPPSFTALNEEVREDSTAPRIGISPDANDEVSGLAGFEASIDDTEYVALSLVDGNYLTDPLSPGTHTIRVRAIDEAGNVSAIRTFTVMVEPIAGPTILTVTQDPRVGTPITVTGTAPVPGTKVYVVFQHPKQEESAVAVVEDDGTFTATLSGGLARGTYQIGAYVEDERGARSLMVEGGKLVVHGPPLDATVLLIAQILGAIAVLMAIIGGAIWALLALGVRIAQKRSELLVELREADTITRKAFSLLRKDVAGYATYLKRQKRTRPLSSEEEEFIEGIIEDLTGSERVIRKEIADAAAEAHKTPRKRKSVEDLE